MESRERSSDHNQFRCKYEGRSAAGRAAAAVVIAAIITAGGTLIAAKINKNTSESAREITIKIEAAEEVMNENHDRNLRALRQLDRYLEMIADATLNEESYARRRHGALNNAILISEHQIQELIAGSEGLLVCDYERAGNDYILELRGKGEFYPGAAYRVEEAPNAKLLADTLIDIVTLFRLVPEYQNDDLSMYAQVHGTADSLQLRATPAYAGPDSTCVIDGTPMLLRSSTTINNHILGCARAALFAYYLERGSRTGLQPTLSGHEYSSGPTDGQRRFVRINLTFRNLLKFAPAASLCRREQ